MYFLHQKCTNAFVSCTFFSSFKKPSHISFRNRNAMYTTDCNMKIERSFKRTTPKWFERCKMEKKVKGTRWKKSN